ncbi:COG1470 family protein [Microlunatus ginsengisoli]|uniref:Zinc ribbon domain-containing protein n=1 Tax=Microlunatus ginsengisoli TaxID=363863 RepID=A0ABP7AHQ8_9ACTN
MDSRVCSVCGERNPPGTEFCVQCQNYLGWDKSILAAPEDVRRRPEDQQSAAETRQIPRVTEQGPAPATDEDPDDLVADDRFRVAVDNPNVTVAPTGEVAELELRVRNISIRVDGYLAELAPGGGPDWLTVKSSAVELLPGTDEVIRARFQVVATTLTPAQQLTVRLRVRAMNEPLAVVELPVSVTVSVVDAPLQLRAEPRLLRVQDRADAAFTLTVDNSMSNRAISAQLAGTDPELAVRFGFDPPVVQVGPASVATVRVSVGADRPAPGQEASRLLTVSVREGTRTAETAVTFVQISSVQVEDPPVGITLEPAVIKVRDNPVGTTRLTLDNRNGREWAHVQLSASDPEQVVYVGFDTPQVHVPPGQTAQAQVRLQAALPELGTEASRTVTITATDPKRRTSTAVATFVQTASASPMTTLGLSLEPEITKVRDADGASTQLVIDNRKGRFRVRLRLSGADPERAVGFAFAPDVVDVEAGMVRRIEVRMAAWRPPPGQEWSRQITISATDGQASVQATGSLVQSSSRSAMETLTMRLDPSVLRLDRRRGAFSALVDNRNGVQPIRVTLSGDDPENCIRFSFAPAVLDVPPGGVGRSTVTVDAPGVGSGREVNRNFVIMASDGRADIQSNGTLVQQGGDWRPVARVLFTLFGGLLMFFGAFLEWTTEGRTGFGLSARFMTERFGFGLLLERRFDAFTSAGAAVALLAIVMVFGLTGRSGRLTRLAALAAAAVVVGVFVASAFSQQGMLIPSWGAIVVVAGCVLGYIGGLLVKR